MVYASERSLGKIIPGDIVYFKDSGEPVTLRAIAADVLQFDNLTPARVNALLQQYGNQHGLTSADIPHYYELFKNKRYCMLIFLKGVEAVTPFHINKRGYGAMAAWLMTSDINKIKRTSSR